MKKVDAVREFKSGLMVGQFYDYWTLQEMWSAFTDALCKSGEITAYQWRTWATPVKYGRTVCLNVDGKWFYK